MSVERRYSSPKLKIQAGNFGVESLEQSGKLDRLAILISLAIAFSKHHFFPNRLPKSSAFTVFWFFFLFCFVVLLFFFCIFLFFCCIVIAVKTSAIVSLANFQRNQMLRHPRLAFDWLSVSFFHYWPIRMSGLLFSLHWINPLLHRITWKLHLS